MCKPLQHAPNNGSQLYAAIITYIGCSHLRFTVTMLHAGMYAPNWQ